MDKKPGVADNKSYKNMYHFNDNFFDKADRGALPSINADPKINSTIKENPYRSNVEIEKDEVIFKPDLTALFKAKGKTHKQGGIDVMLEPNSFVFSDDKTLAFTERDHKMFEFKEGGTFKAVKNTPADVLKRNVDTEHYNRLISNISDLKKDDLAKKSSMMMLEKYLETLGQIAYVQEEKKNFPTGVPSFAANTAPVYNTEVKDDIMEQKQYAKYGGTIGNPYMQGGGQSGYEWFKPWTKSNTVKGATSPTGYVPTTFNTDVKSQYNNLSEWEKIAGRKFKSMEDLQGYMYSSLEESGSSDIDDMWTKFGHTAKNKNEGVDNFADGIMGIRTAEALSMRPNPKIPPRVPMGTPELITSNSLKIAGPTIGGQPKGLTPNEPMGAVDTGKEINWQFTPWQKLSQSYNLGKLAGVKRYMPMRSHLNPSYVDPYLVNPEQAVGDMQSSANQNIGALNTLNPILRNAQASAFSGDLLNRIPGLRNQYDNQNAQIMGQNRAMNNQIANNAKAQNMQNDQTYYQQTIAGQANYDNMKGFLGDQYMNNVMGDVQDNQTLAFNLATLNNPAYGFNFKTGNSFNRNPKNIKDMVGDSKADMYTQVGQVIFNKIKNGQTPTKEEADFFRSLSVSKMGFTGKKGGIKGNNPYK